jgi:hypothetical protein
VIGGFFFYLVGAFIGVIFIPTLEMSDNGCKDWVENRTGYGSDKECVRFKDKIEELKYLHNQRMAKRSSHKMFALFPFAAFVTYLLMLFNPHAFFDNKIGLKDNTGVIVSAIYFGVILGFIMPIIYQELLPPPIEWFPKEFIEIRQARIELILKEILEMSELPSHEGLPP